MRRVAPLHPQRSWHYIARYLAVGVDIMRDKTTAQPVGHPASSLSLGHAGSEEKGGGGTKRPSYLQCATSIQTLIIIRVFPVNQDLSLKACCTAWYRPMPRAHLLHSWQNQN